MKKATVTISGHELLIKINGITHFRADRREIAGYQSWDENNGGKPNYVIEFYMKDGCPEIPLEYSKKARWLEVLTSLDTIKLWPVTANRA